MIELIVEEVVDFIFVLVKVIREIIFFEFGVGIGFNVIFLVRCGYFVIGVDIF